MRPYDVAEGRVGREHSRPQYAAAIRYALHRLEYELPSSLTYHSLTHTRNDVLPSAVRLAALEGVGNKPRHLLRVAAAFHDIGFVDHYDNHETSSIQIASAALPHFGFAAADVSAIAGMIRATRLPQAPTTLLEALLADADLDSLGRDDFIATSLALRAELAARGCRVDETVWFAQQLSFLQTHHYWTLSAHRLRHAQKQRNIQLLKAHIALLKPHLSPVACNCPQGQASYPVCRLSNHPYAPVESEAGHDT